MKDAAQLLTQKICLTACASPCVQALTDLISSSSSESEHGRRSNSCDGRDSLSAVLAAAEVTFGGSSSGSCSSEEPPRGSRGSSGRDSAYDRCACRDCSEKVTTSILLYTMILAICSR